MPGLSVIPNTCTSSRCALANPGFATIVLAALLPWHSLAQTAAEPDIFELDIDELLDVNVTTVSKREEKAQQAAAAIQVISNEDIRRSGANTIMEALRMVPGMEIAQADSNGWAITGRGFNDQFSNKLLVMIDGRSVYVPEFSGVHWDSQDTVLEDIDRIEVVRGPGGTLWGANAVNGVINIITKNAKETQGTLVSGGGGTEDHVILSARHGHKLADDLYLRIFGKYTDRDDTKIPYGGDAGDDWWVARGGFRLDWEPSNMTEMTFQGDIYGGDVNQRLTLNSLVPPFSTVVDSESDISGGNLLGRWTQALPDASDLTVQTYYDRYERDTDLIGIERDTFDLEVKHRFGWGDWNEVVWGGGYRYSTADYSNSFDTRFPDESIEVFNAFVQDEVTLIPETLAVIAGTKVSHNDFTDFEIQPSARVRWTPTDRQTLWGAVSRAVRTPSEAENSAIVNQTVIPGVPPTEISLVGNSGFDSEELVSFELGYRIQPTKQIAVDLATFYNVYDHLRSFEIGTPFLTSLPPPPHVLSPVYADNNLDGESYGAEIGLTYIAADWWRLIANYTYFNLQLHTSSASTDTISEGAEGDSPHHQVGLRSLMDITKEIEFDAFLRYVDVLRNQGIDSYVELTLRLGWRPRDNLEFSIVGNNLLDSQHGEFAPSFIRKPAAEIQRSVFGKVTFSF